MICNDPHCAHGYLHKDCPYCAVSGEIRELKAQLTAEREAHKATKQVLEEVDKKTIEDHRYDDCDGRFEPFCIYCYQGQHEPHADDCIYQAALAREAARRETKERG